MIRPVLTEFALFVAPFVAFAFFLWITKTAVLDRSSWSPKTLASLAIVALVLMLGSFLYLSHFSGAPPGSNYIPAHFDEQGRFVPGETK
jgi:hypothetical protein